MACLRRVGLAVLVLLAAGACGPDRSQGHVDDKDGKYVLVAPEEMSEAGYGFPAGTIVLVGDCVGLDLGNKVAVAIWPHGTEWVSADPLVIDVPGVGRVGEGDVLEGGGADYDGPDPLPGIEVPSSCRDRPLVSFTPDR